MSAPSKFDLEAATPFGKETPTPGDLAIAPRDRRFSRKEAMPRWWFNGDPLATAWHNALSIAFPRGEVFFIESIKPFRADAPPKLEREIRAFILQEVNHTREHIAFNKAPREAGYALAGLDRRVDATLAIADGRPPIANLAATMALEHFTAIMASQQLRDPERFLGVPAELAELWLWHAVEEIEHKAVAYDTWLHATRDWSRWKRWKVKSLLMLIVTRNFLRDRLADMHDLLAQDGLTGLKWRIRVLAYLFGRPGMLRRIFPAWVAFFLPGFHPWKTDDRPLIRKFDSEFSDAVMPR